jgi:hypothetical protein
VTGKAMTRNRPSRRLPPPMSRHGTPIPHAVRLGLYCHCRVDGKPASLHDALAAKWSGKAVEMHVPCGKDDPFAEPDPKRVIASLKAK